MKLYFAGALLVVVTCFSTARAAENDLILATTTSTYDTGLLDVLLPPFEKQCKCKVKAIAVGTGQALRMARDGNADVVLVHDRAAEEKFIADGFGVKRHDVMYNDFVLVGPLDDTAKISGKKDVVEAFGILSRSKVRFASRADESGTHKKELAIWEKAGLMPSGTSYIQVGSGMAETLRVANEKGAYCLTDRGTWLAHKKELTGLAIVLEKDPVLINYYSVIAVAPAKHSNVNTTAGEKFIKFLTGSQGQKIIRDFGKDKYGSPFLAPTSLMAKRAIISPSNPHSSIPLPLRKPKRKPAAKASPAPVVSNRDSLDPFLVEEGHGHGHREVGLARSGGKFAFDAFFERYNSFLH
jgi:tungstate transport system substrate-binding protein